MNANKSLANKYWSSKEILKVHALYNLLLGPRGSGKSFDITKLVLTEAYNSNTYQFAYIRRYAMDVKNDTVTSYFADAKVSEITNGDYNSVIAKRGWIYFAKIDEEDEYNITYSRKIGKTFALASGEHYKSLKFPDICDIIFEEFITDNLYLQNEPDKFQELISTILRDREGRVWLIGNTLSRICPYFTEWGLDCVRDLQANEIKVVDVHGVNSKGDEYTIKLAIEMCVAEKLGNGMFFGQRGKSISGAEVWTGGRHPRLPGSYKFDYYKLHEIEFREFNFSFVMQLLCEKKTSNLVIYIYPRTTRREISRKITSEFSIDRMTTVSFMNNIRAEVVMRELMSQKKYCFSDDRTGDDFEHVLDNREGAL